MTIRFQFFENELPLPFAGSVYRIATTKLGGKAPSKE